MRSRKSKWFWAARDMNTSDVWEHYGVHLFPQSKKPVERDRSDRWLDADYQRGGQLCYGMFVRLTGVVLKPGQVKKVFMPEGTFDAFEVRIKPS